MHSLFGILGSQPPGASRVNGYFAGGSSSGTTFGVVTADRLVFATAVTAAQTTANLSQARSRLAGCASYADGYFAGGVTASGAVMVTADRLSFATAVTAAQTTANLSQARELLAGCASYADGFFAGGATNSPFTVFSLTDRLSFATAVTAAQTTANLSQARYRIAGLASYADGYFAGGNTGTRVATADRLTFSTTTTAAQTAANLSTTRELSSGCASYYAGYFGGGYTSAAVATTDQLAFVTGATAAQTTANLSVARSAPAACASYSDGYFVGGATAVTSGVRFNNANRLVFATAATAAQTTANLSQARGFFAGVS